MRHEGRSGLYEVTSILQNNYIDTLHNVLRYGYELRGKCSQDLPNIRNWLDLIDKSTKEELLALVTDKNARKVAADIEASRVKFQAATDALKQYDEEVRLVKYKD